MADKPFSASELLSEDAPPAPAAVAPADTGGAFSATALLDEDRQPSLFERLKRTAAQAVSGVAARVTGAAPSPETQVVATAPPTIAPDVTELAQGPEEATAPSVPSQREMMRREPGAATAGVEPSTTAQGRPGGAPIPGGMRRVRATTPAQIEAEAAAGPVNAQATLARLRDEYAAVNAEATTLQQEFDRLRALANTDRRAAAAAATALAPRADAFTTRLARLPPIPPDLAPFLADETVLTPPTLTTEQRLGTDLPRIPTQARAEFEGAAQRAKLREDMAQLEAARPMWQQLARQLHRGLLEVGRLAGSALEAAPSLPAVAADAVTAIGKGASAPGFGFTTPGLERVALEGRRAAAEEAEAGFAPAAPTALQRAGEAGERVAKFFREAERFYPSAYEDRKLADEPSLALDPKYLSLGVARMLPSFAASLVPAVGAQAAMINVGGRLLPYSPQAVARLARIGAALTGGSVGGLLEGAGAFERARELGWTDVDAAKAMLTMGLATAGLNAISLGKVLEQAGPGLAGRFSKAGRVGLWEAITEYLEEPTEAVILRENIVEALRDGLEVLPPSFLLGALGGFVAGGTAGRGRPRAPRAQPSATVTGGVSLPPEPPVEQRLAIIDAMLSGVEARLPHLQAEATRELTRTARAAGEMKERQPEIDRRWARMFAGDVLADLQGEITELRASGDTQTADELEQWLSGRAGPEQGYRGPQAGLTPGQATADFVRRRNERATREGIQRSDAATRIEDEDRAGAAVALRALRPGDLVTLQDGTEVRVEAAGERPTAARTSGEAQGVPIALDPDMLLGASVVHPPRPEGATIVRKAPKPAPVVFAFWQPALGGRAPVAMYHLTEDIPGHPRGSTLSAAVLEREGFGVPEPEIAQPQTEEEWAAHVADAKANRGAARLLGERAPSPPETPAPEDPRAAQAMFDDLVWGNPLTREAGGVSREEALDRVRERHRDFQPQPRAGMPVVITGGREAGQRGIIRLLARGQVSRGAFVDGETPVVVDTEDGRRVQTLVKNIALAPPFGPGAGVAETQEPASAPVGEGPPTVDQGPDAAEPSTAVPSQAVDKSAEPKVQPPSATAAAEGDVHDLAGMSLEDLRLAPIGARVRDPRGRVHRKTGIDQNVPESVAETQREYWDEEGTGESVRRAQSTATLYGMTDAGRAEFERARTEDRAERERSEAAERERKEAERQPTAPAEPEPEQSPEEREATDAYREREQWAGLVESEKRRIARLRRQNVKPTVIARHQKTLETQQAKLAAAEARLGAAIRARSAALRGEARAPAETAQEPEGPAGAASVTVEAINVLSAIAEERVRRIVENAFIDQALKKPGAGKLNVDDLPIRGAILTNAFGSKEGNKTDAATKRALPLIAQLENAGLVTTGQTDEGRTVRLTDAGKKLLPGRVEPTEEDYTARGVRREAAETEPPAAGQDDLFGDTKVSQNDTKLPPTAAAAPALRKLIIVGCCEAKHETTRAARDLYRSDLFRKSRAYAENETRGPGAEWMILSAKHGLLRPDDEIEPYDLRLGELDLTEEAALRMRVREQLRTIAGPETEIVIVAGSDYGTLLRDATKGLGLDNVSEPLRGLGIGQRLKWLKERTAPVEPEGERPAAPPVAPAPTVDVERAGQIGQMLGETGINGRVRIGDRVWVKTAEEQDGDAWRVEDGDETAKGVAIVERARAAGWDVEKLESPQGEVTPLSPPEPAEAGRPDEEDVDEAGRSPRGRSGPGIRNKPQKYTWRDLWQRPGQQIAETIKELQARLAALTGDKGRKALERQIAEAREALAATTAEWPEIERRALAAYEALRDVGERVALEDKDASDPEVDAVFRAYVAIYDEIARAHGGEDAVERVRHRVEGDFGHATAEFNRRQGYEIAMPKGGYIENYTVAELDALPLGSHLDGRYDGPAPYGAHKLHNGRWDSIGHFDRIPGRGRTDRPVSATELRDMGITADGGAVPVEYERPGGRRHGFIRASLRGIGSTYSGSDVDGVRHIDHSGFDITDYPDEIRAEIAHLRGLIDRGEVVKDELKRASGYLRRLEARLRELTGAGGEKTPAPKKAKPPKAAPRPAREGSRYEGDDLNDVLPRVEEEQGARWANIQALETQLQTPKLSDKRRASLQQTIGEYRAEYDGVYAEVVDAAGEHEATAMRARVEGAAPEGPGTPATSDDIPPVATLRQAEGGTTLTADYADGTTRAWRKVGNRDAWEELDDGKGTGRVVPALAVTTPLRHAADAGKIRRVTLTPPPGAAPPVSRYEDGTEARIGDRVQYTIHGPDGKKGTVILVVETGGLRVRWDDGTQGPVAMPSIAKLDEPPPSPAAEGAYGADNTLVTADQAEEARKRLRDKLKRLTAGIDPTLIPDMVTVGLFHFEAGTRELAAWSAKMVEDLGEAVRPYLANLFGMVRTQYEQAPPKAPPPARPGPRRVEPVRAPVLEGQPAQEPIDFGAASRSDFDPKNIRQLMAFVRGHGGIAPSEASDLQGAYRDLPFQFKNRKGLTAARMAELVASESGDADFNDVELLSRLTRYKQLLRGQGATDAALRGEGEFDDYADEAAEPTEPDETLFDVDPDAIVQEINAGLLAEPGSPARARADDLVQWANALVDEHGDAETAIAAVYTPGGAAIATTPGGVLLSVEEQRAIIRALFPGKTEDAEPVEAAPVTDLEPTARRPIRGEIIVNTQGDRFEVTHVYPDETILARPVNGTDEVDLGRWPIPGFSNTEQTLLTPLTEPPVETPSRLARLADAFYAEMKSGQMAKDPRAIRVTAARVLGISEQAIRADAALTDDIFDAIEVALNRSYRENRNASAPLIEQVQRAQQTEAYLGNRTRTIEITKRQQFSTPLPIAELAAFAAQLVPGERVLEPTAGTGNLLAPVDERRHTVTAIELDARRIEALRANDYAPTQGDYLRTIIATEDKPDVVIMNPPWGKYTTGKYGKGVALGFDPVDVAERFVAKALRDVREGGRVVAVMPTTVLKSPSFMRWLHEHHTVRAVVEMPPGSYNTRGTSVDSVLLVVDRGGKTDGSIDVRAAATDFADAVRILERLDLERAPAPRPADRAPSAAPAPGGAGPAVRPAPTARPPRGGQPGREPQAPGGGPASGARGGAAAPVVPEPPVDAGDREPGRGAEAGVPGVGGRSAAGAGEPRPPVVPVEPGRPAAVRAGSDAGVSGDARSAVPDPRPVELPAALAGQRFSVADASELEAAARSAVFAPAPLRAAPGLNPHPRLIVITRSLAGAKRPALTYRPQGRMMADAYDRKIISDQQLDYGILPAMQANENRRGFLVAADVGVGKSRVAAAVISEWLETGKANHVLYVTATETNVQDVMKEFAVYAGGERYPYEFIPVRSFKDAKERPSKKSEYSPLPKPAKAVYIIDRFNLADFRRALLEIGFDAIVGDEAHLYKNIGGSTVGAAWLDLQKQALERGRFLYLTATPAVDFDDLEHFIGLREWTADGWEDYKARVTGSGRSARGDLDALKRDLTTLLTHARTVDAAAAAQLEADIDPAAIGRLDFTKRQGAYRSAISKVRKWLGDRGALTSVAAIEAGADSDAAGVTAGGGHQGGRRGGFMRGRDPFGVRITPAEQEQIMRELVQKGVYDSVDLWRAGVEFEILTTPLTRDQVLEYRRLAEFFAKLNEAFLKFGRLNEARRFYTIRHFLQQEAKRRMFDYRLPIAIEQARASLARGEQPVISTISVSEGKEDEGPIPAAINTINTHEIEVTDGGEIIDHGEIPEALVVQGELMEEWRRFRRVPDPVREILNAFGEGNVAVVTGKVGPQDRVRMIAEFQDGTRRVAAISGAGKTGISLHHVLDLLEGARGRRHLIVSDYEWSATMFKQELGRVDRSGELSAPRITPLSTGAAGEKKFLATIANRMRNLGALSKGSAESASNEQLTEFEIGGSLDTHAMREAYRRLPDDVKDLFLGSPWKETITDPQFGNITRNTRGYPQEADLKTFLLDLQFMPPEDADVAFNMFWQVRQEMIAAEEGVDTEVIQAARTTTAQAEVRRTTVINHDLTIYEVHVADPETAKRLGAHRFGLLRGIVTDYMDMIAPFLDKSRAGQPYRQYVSVQIGEEQVSGLKLREGVLPLFAKQFQVMLGGGLDTPEQIMDALRAGEEVFLQTELGLSLRMRQDGRIQIEGARMKDQKTLIENGGAYVPAGKWWLLKEENLARFLARFPVKKLQGEGPPEGPGGGARAEPPRRPGEPLSEEIREPARPRRESIAIRNEVTGFSHGQMDGYMQATDRDGAPVAHLDWSSYQDEVLIRMIAVAPQRRREGIARQLVGRLRREFPEARIEWGYTTAEGQALRRALERPGEDVGPRREGGGASFSRAEEPAEYPERRTASRVALVGRTVHARRRIAQSPTSSAPTVPTGRRGSVEDYDQANDTYLVDFGGPYGTVMVSPDELKGASLSRPTPPGEEPERATVRLYRGEGTGQLGLVPEWVRDARKAEGIEDATGRWFTDDPAIAQWYVEEAGEGGRVVYVDVPRPMLDRWRVSQQPRAIARFSRDPEHEFFVPREVAARKQSLVRTERTPLGDQVLVPGTPPRALPPTPLRAPKTQRGIEALPLFRPPGAPEGQGDLFSHARATRPGEDPERRARIVYFEMLPMDEQDALLDRYRDEVARLDQIAYPITAQTHDGETVTILGPANRFEPYASHPAGRGSSHWLLTEGAPGRAIRTAGDLLVDGRRLISTTPPRLPRPVPFTPDLNGPAYLEATEVGTEPERGLPAIATTAAFRAWFADSQVRETGGDPLVVYHGTATPGFEAIDPDKLSPGSLYGPGFYTTSTPEVASSYGRKGRGQAVRRRKDRDALIEQIRRLPGYRDDLHGAFLRAFRRNGDTSDIREIMGAATSIPHNRLVGLDDVLDRALGAGAVYPVYLRITAPVDMDGPLTEDMARRIADAIDAAGWPTTAFPSGLGLRDYLRVMAERGENVERALTSISNLVATAERMVTVSDGKGGTRTAKAITPLGKARWPELFQIAGYDGITHRGGQIVGGLGPHTVWIAFHPDQVKSALSPDFSRAEALMRTGGGGAERRIGVGLRTRGAKAIGASNYQGDLAAVTVKELVQNALDAVRAREGWEMGGALSVDYDTKAHQVTARDNGTGMTPETVEGALMDLGGSGEEKLAGATTGGFGLAKAAIFGNAEEIEIQTVTPAPDDTGEQRGFVGRLLGRGPERILTTVRGSADDWLNGTLRMTVERVAGRETGTYIRVKLQAETDKGPATRSDVRRAMEAISARSLTPAILAFSIDGQAVTGVRDPVTKLGTVETAHAIADVYAGGPLAKGLFGSKYRTAHYLNTGLYQFGEGYNSQSADLELPRTVIVDVRSKVPPDDLHYPWLANRQSLKGYDVQRAVDTLLVERLIQPAMQRYAQGFKDALLAAPSIPGTDRKLIDTTLSTPLDTLAALAARPHTARLARGIAEAFEILQTRLARFGDAYRGARLDGLSVDPTYLGVNLLGERYGTPHNAIFLNPYALAERAAFEVQNGTLDASEAPRFWIDSMVGTLLHELAHQAVRSEDAAFSGALTRAAGYTISEQAEARNAIARALGDEEAAYHAVHADERTVRPFVQDRTNVFGEGASSLAAPVQPGGGEGAPGPREAGGGGPGAGVRGGGEERAALPRDRAAELGGRRPVDVRIFANRVELTYRLDPGSALAAARAMFVPEPDRIIGPTPHPTDAALVRVTGVFPDRIIAVEEFDRALRVRDAGARPDPGARPVAASAEAPSIAPPEPPAAAPTPETPQDVVDKRRMVLALEEAVGRPIRVGRIRGRRTIRGQYFPQPEVVRIRQAAMIGTAAHEIGHHLSKRRLLDTAGYEATLRRWVDERGLKGDPLEEGRAELVRKMVEEYPRLRAEVPGLVDRLEARLRADWPELLGAVEHVRGLLDQFRSAPLDARLEAMIDRREGKGFELAMPDFQTWFQRWYERIYEDVYPFKLFDRAARRLEIAPPRPTLRPLTREERRVVRDVEGLPASRQVHLLARTLRFSAGAAEAFLGLGPTPLASRRAGPIDWHTLRVRDDVPSFREIIRPIWRKRAAFERYLIYNRTMELLTATDERTGEPVERLRNAGRGVLTALGAPGQALVTIEDIERTSRDLAREHPEFAQAAERLHRWNDALIDYMEASGRYPPAVIAAIRRLHKNYVPFYRVFEEHEDDALARTQGPGRGGEFANVGSPLKTIRGSERRFVSPLESFVRNAYAMVSAANRNEVGAQLVKRASEIEGLGEFVIKVQDATEPVVFTLEQIRDKLVAAGIPEEVLDEADLNVVATVFHPVRDLSRNIVTIYVDGQRGVYQLDPTLYRALLALDRTTMPIWFNALRVVARIVRAGKILDPFYIVRNMLKDQQTLGIQGRGIPFLGYTQGLLEMVRGSDEFWRWKAAGGGMMSSLALDREEMEKRLTEIIEGRRPYTFVDPRHPVRMVRAWLDLMAAGTEFSEAPTRIGAFRRVLDEPFDEDVTERDRVLRAVFEAHESTLDFGRRGSWSAAWQLAVFANAWLQDQDKIVRTAKAHPLKFSVVAAAMITAELLLYLWNRDEEEYQSISSFRKDAFYNFVVPGRWLGRPDGRGFTISLPGAFTYKVLFGAIPRRVFEWLDDTNPQILKNLAQTVGEGLSQSFVPAVGIGILSNYANVRPLYGGPVVSRRLEGVSPEEQFTSRTSSTAKVIGRLLDYPPLKVDNLIDAYLGKPGWLATQIVDLGVDLLVPPPHTGAPPARSILEAPGMRTLFLKSPSLHGEVVERFYDFRDQAARATATAKKLQDEGRYTVEWHRAHAFELAIAHSFEAQARRFARWRTTMAETERDPGLSGAVKRERLDAIARDIVRLAHERVDGAERLRAALRDRPAP